MDPNSLQNMENVLQGIHIQIGTMKEVLGTLNSMVKFYNQ